MSTETNLTVLSARSAAIVGLVPQTLEDAYRLAAAVAKSGLAPKDMRTPEAILVAILTGLEIGLKPMFALNKIAVINGRPTLWGDAIPGILWARGFKLREWMDGDVAYCEVTRPGGETIERTFSIEDAKAAGLWGKAGPWKQYPSRMLQMRARAFAARDGASDVLGGLYVTEELQGGELQVVDGHSEPFQRKSSAEGKRDGSVKRFNEILVAIKQAPDLETLHAIKFEHMDEAGNAWASMPRQWADTIEQDYQLREEDLSKEPDEAAQ